MDRGDLLYARNPGCVAYMSDGGPPRQCGGDEAWAVPHTYLYPQRQRTRLYVCDFHGRDRPGAEPLTGRDRAIIAARRTDERNALARAGRLDLLPPDRRGASS
ncbi:hypothetical protein [Pseudonocardia alni]|uniref:hypothetical protein n=1 Tax=Pseudonocardia alni TaxID=33907 RepID=UPI00332D12C0